MTALLKKATKHSDNKPSKRDAILTAALKVFAERGLNGVAVPEIAELANVGTGTIYRYFDSKSDLVNELFMNEKHRLHAFLKEGVIDINQPPKDIFAAYWRRMISFGRTYPDSFKFLELQDHLPYLNEGAREVEREALRRLNDINKSLQNKGVFRRDIRSDIILTMIWGSIVSLFKSDHLGYITLSDADIEAAREACWRMCATPEYVDR